MDDVLDVPKRGKGWAFVTSAVLHAVIAALLFLKLPETKPEPPKDEAVKVDIVQEKDAPKPPEEKAADQPPPPPPPPPQQEAKTEQPANVPVPTLRPVFEFGQKDQGPSQQDGSASEGEKDATDELADKKPDAPKAEEPKAVTEEASKEPPKDDLPGVPDILKALEQQEAASAAAAGKPVEEKAATPKPADAPELKKARKLYSDAAVGGQAAVMAMGDMPRETRVGQLCATELREQLRHATPRYNPLMLPAYRLRFGNVLDVPKAAFRTPSDWYDVSFQCEVDDGGLKVVSFSFKVGDRVPQSEWKARRFPEN
ncbi:DUF930 domain-containing protein [Rhizobium sp. C4]|uniref:DUF930 domain-containing protein n=1 Tax=Rhizobium sp. C4 TaxID=1349800 RepID=UPI001E611B27|nr:DUF930 domain-containing protein [Rhizobium sp. C4]MCD2175925.1 DUF930 domain-containing protein [Rhizobium sp. C4]